MGSWVSFLESGCVHYSSLLSKGHILPQLEWIQIKFSFPVYIKTLVHNIKEALTFLPHYYTAILSVHYND